MNQFIKTEILKAMAVSDRQDEQWRDEDTAWLAQENILKYMVENETELIALIQYYKQKIKQV